VSNSVESINRFRLGELLVQFDFAAPSDLAEMLSIANETSMPVGRVFVLTGVISESDLENLILCQSFLKEKLLDIEQAKKAMHMAREKKVPLEQALTHLGWAPSDSLQETTPLGELLIASNYISRTQLEAALSHQKKSGLPFGRTLVLGGTISESLLAAAVNAQIMIRDQKIDKEQAVIALKESRRRQISFETSLQAKGFYDLPKRSAPRIGEILTFAGVISDSELVGALETGLITKMPVGEVLVSSKFLTRELLDAALASQKLLADAAIGFGDVRTILDHVKDGKEFDWAIKSLREDGVKPPKPQPPSLLAFLKMLRCLDDEEVTQAFETAKHNTQIISQVLLIGGTMDENTLKKADECRTLVHEGRLTLEHATIAFDYSRRRAISISEALKELQWHESKDVDRTMQSKEPESSFTKAQGQPTAATETQTAATSPASTNSAGASSTADAAAGAGAGADAQATTADTTKKNAQPAAGAGGKETAAATGAASAGPNVNLGSMQQVALQLTARGDYKGARQVWNEIIQYLSQPYDSRYCECLEGVAETYTLEQNFAMARTLYQAALDSRVEMHGEDSLSAAFALSNMGRIAYFQQKYPEAEQFGREHIRIIAHNMGADHPDVACGYQNLATVYHVQNKHSAAENAYKIAVKICVAKLGDTHPTTTRIARNYASLLQKMDRIAEAQNIDPLASGTISGSWRALEVPDDDKLYADRADSDR
jgi:tetratricopeptide (TPR) repeat protein